jgi:hypothetical protein
MAVWYYVERLTHRMSSNWIIQHETCEIFDLLGCYAAYIGSFGQNLSTPSLRVKEPKKKIETKVGPCCPKDTAAAAGIWWCLCAAATRGTRRKKYMGETSSLQDVAIQSFVYFIWFWPTVLPDSAMNQGRLSTCNLFGPSSNHLQGIPLSYLDRIISDPDKRFPLNFSIPTD